MPVAAIQLLIGLGLLVPRTARLGLAAVDAGLPALYDMTLSSTAVHELEHSLFLATGFLFWSVVTY
jgi:caa3-type cytochrome oxidase assembly factor Caa3/CtaG